MNLYLIRVDDHSYTKRFSHSVDAVIDALDCFPGASRISVKIVK